MELLVRNTKNFFAEDTPEFKAIEILWTGFLSIMQKRNYMKYVTPNLLRSNQEKSAPSTDDGYASHDVPNSRGIRIPAPIPSVRKSKRRRTEGPDTARELTIEPKKPRLSFPIENNTAAPLCLPMPAVKELPKLDPDLARKQNKCKEISVVLHRIESPSPRSKSTEGESSAKEIIPTNFEAALQKRKSIRIAIAASILAIPDRPMAPSPPPEVYADSTAEFKMLYYLFKHF